MPRQTTWRSINGRWTRSLGSRGVRVRIHQLQQGGNYYRDVWTPGHGKSRKCLYTSNRDEAEKLGKALLAALLTQETPTPGPRILTLGSLWDRYRTEAPAFLDNATTSRDDAESRAEVLLAYFGRDRDVRTLSAVDQAAYTAARLAGGIRCGVKRITPKVRARSVEADLVLLHHMLNWAATVREHGVRLLDGNPLAGVRRVREKNPRRPVATYERFLATRQALQRLANEAENDRERERWIKIELALVIAEAAGRRIGSVRQLRWEDIDFDQRTIHWRAEADKKRYDAVIPMPESLVEELRSFQRRLGALGGNVFPSETDPARAMDRHLFDKWLARAESKAGLKKLEGGLWHPYRRGWATARKHLPIKDVAAAGGWRATASLLECYQQPTNDTILAVMSEDRKVHERAVS